MHGVSILTLLVKALILLCSKLTAQQRALLQAFAETEKDIEGTVKTFDGKYCLKF